MKNLNFTAFAQHNKAKIKRDTRVFFYLMAVCVVIMVIARQFYGRYTAEYVYVKSGDEVTLGWPASLFGIAAFMLIAFALMLVYNLFKQDLKQPALGITNAGLFINLQITRNAFVPWDNIEKIELRGHIAAPVLRIFFKDINAVIKGQFFVLKSISRASLKSNPSIGISGAETVGNLVSIYTLMEEKGVTSINRMAGGK